DNSLSSSSTQHIINAIESDYMIECVNQFKNIIVGMANERSTDANTSRLETWSRITDMFNNKFGLDVTTKALKSNLSYRQSKLRRNPNKCKIYRDWLIDNSKTERQMENELGKGDFILLKLFGDDMDKPQSKRRMDDVGASATTEWYSNEHEESPFQSDSIFMEGQPKEEFDPDLYEVKSIESLPPSEITPIKRSRMDSSNSHPQPLPIPPPSFIVNRMDDESLLRIELLKAQIELTKTQQTAAEKQIQANAAMILMMDKLAN
ncbi:hypothetical protein PENTCL1PPCAC_17588, partial [Pristionchus entomophagus]